MNNNRGNNNRRRGRGNNNRQQGGGQQINRIDSRARGNAPQMLEKYRKLAHDAHLNGDRVTEEYYLQFADHYFRVIADTRQRQEEQRLRRDDRWQEGDGDRDEVEEIEGYAPDSPYAVYDQQNFQQRPREDRPREDRQRDDRPRDDRPREDRSREDRPRDDRPREERPREDRQRDDRPREDRPREDRPRHQRPREDRVEAAETEAADPAVAEAAEGGDGNPYEPPENPFTRGSRGLKPRREDRRPRRRDGEDAVASDDSAPAGLDPSALPPAIASRAEPEVADEAAEDKPRRRTRRAKPPADDAGETLEAVS